MEPDKNNAPAEGEKPKDGQQAPADALSRTPEDLDAEQAASGTADTGAGANPDEKKVSPIKKVFRKINLYLLIFILLAVVTGAVLVINYLNSQKAPPQPNLATQTLSQDALKQLANTDASVGNTSQTLTIQGNAVISGQALTRGAMNVAGNLQTGGSIQGPSLTISGTSNLGTAQINTLQVAQTTAIQGATTLHDLNVAGTSTFSGAMTASQITASKLVLSGNAVLEIPNHLALTGPSPSRGATGSFTATGGSVSINGSDTTGTININSGNSAYHGCFVQITFHQAYVTNPHVIISPVGSAAGSIQYYVTRDKSGFSVCTNTDVAAHQVFAYDYFVTG